MAVSFMFVITESCILDWFLVGFIRHAVLRCAVSIRKIEYNCSEMRRKRAYSSRCSSRWRHRSLIRTEANYYYSKHCSLGRRFKWNARKFRNFQWHNTQAALIRTWYKWIESLRIQAAAAQFLLSTLTTIQKWLIAQLRLCVWAIRIHVRYSRCISQFHTLALFTGNLFGAVVYTKVNTKNVFYLFVSSSAHTHCTQYLDDIMNGSSNFLCDELRNKCKRLTALQHRDYLYNSTTLHGTPDRSHAF